MATGNDQFTIPLGIDPRNFMTGLDEIESGLVSVTTKAKEATTAISQSMESTNKAAEGLTAKMVSGAQAAKNFSDAAKAAGKDMNEAFNPDKIKTDGLKQKIAEFVATLRNAAGKPVDFKFNIDQTAVKTLVQKLTEAKGEMQAFNLVLETAKERLKGLVPGTQAFTELNTQIQTAEGFLKQLGDEAGDTDEKMKPLRQQLRQMREELAQMELAGKGGTQEFKELSKRAGEVADQIQDTSQRIKNLASDTKLLDAGITAVRGLAGAFAAGQGALAAFGDQNEEAARAIQKVQGALAILQGIQEVANVLNKDSALIVYLKTFATKANTEATVENAVATEGQAAATAEATVATEGFTAALLANPIVLVTAALAAITFAIYKFATAQKDSKLSVDQLNEALKRQQEILQGDFAIIQRRQSLDEAEANAQRKHQSFLTQIKINALKDKIKIDEQDILAKKQKLNQIEVTNKEELKAFTDLQDDIRKSEEKQKDDANALQVAFIEQQTQFRDERFKLALDMLREQQAALDAEVAILAEARNLQNQISAARLSQLKDGQEKEIALLRQGLKEKLETIDAEGAAKLKKLQDDRRALDFDLETDKKLLAQKKKNLDEQIKLELANGATRLELKKALTEAEALEELKIELKHAQEKFDFENDLLIRNLNLEKESADKRIAIKQAEAEREIQMVDRSNRAEEEKDRLKLAILEQFTKDADEISLDFQLKQIDLEKTSNDTRIMEQKRFFDKSRDGQAFNNVLLLKNQLEAEQKKLDALRKAGKEESDVLVVNARNAVARATAAYNDAVREAKPVDIWEMLFPGDEKGQKAAKAVVSALGEIGKAIQAYTDFAIAQQQRLIDAQQKKIDKDDKDLEDLKGRLKDEKALRDQGYANNVAAIEKEIAAKNAQRNEDIKKQEEYKKKMQQLQRAQLTADTILQASNLVTAATNIYKATSTLGPIGVVTGGVAIAAMIASFAYSKAKAFEAVNSGATIMEKGGMVKGKSHKQGGQKYYSPDPSAGVVELEEGEHVTSKRQTEKYLPLLQAINDDKLKHLTDSQLFKLLKDTGVHVQSDKQHSEAVRESREFAFHQVNQINVEGTKTPEELKNIDRTLQLMYSNNTKQVQTYEEGGYIVKKQGQTIIKVRKQS